MLIDKTCKLIYLTTFCLFLLSSVKFTEAQDECDEKKLVVDQMSENNGTYELDLSK